MNEKTIRLLNIWNTLDSDLNLEIEAAERQLQSVKKRLNGLKYDIFLFFVMLVVPLAVIVHMSYVPNDGSVMYILWAGAQSLIAGVYLFVSPFLLFRLILSIVLYVMNRPPKVVPEIALQVRGEVHRREAVKPERNFWIEEQKLIAALSKYYIKRQNLDDMKKRILSESEELTRADLENDFNRIPYYVEVRPANSFSSPMMKKAMKITFAICGVIVLLVVISVIL